MPIPQIGQQMINHILNSFFEDPRIFMLHWGNGGIIDIARFLELFRDSTMIEFKKLYYLCVESENSIKTCINHQIEDMKLTDDMEIMMDFWSRILKDIEIVYSLQGQDELKIINTLININCYYVDKLKDM